MESEKKVELFLKLKEEFEDATNLEDFGNLETKFEIDEEYSDEKNLIVDLEINWRETRTINIRLSINIDEKLEVNQYEDVWEEWNSFGWEVTRLWQCLFLEALDD